MLPPRTVAPARQRVRLRGRLPARVSHRRPALRAVAGSGLYLAALALLALGIAAIVRHTATAITLVLALMFVPPIAAGRLPEGLSEPLQKLSPMAGLAVQETVERPDSIPIGPWAGLAVVGAYALGALVVAAVLIQRRDA